jgi:hypothetical protein
MAIYKCKKCGQAFRYCRGCMVSAILYHEAGYCSKTCYIDAKNQKLKEVIQTEDVEVVKTDRDISTSK